MATPKLGLRFAPERIDYWASRYSYGEDSHIKEMADRSRSAGYFEKPDFLAICRWKSPRIVSRCQEPYPIIDFRALWSLGWDLDRGIDFNFEFWSGCVQFCRNAVAEYDVSMRLLDRALWQYSKENQK